MSKTFTIQISSFKPPFMREKMIEQNTVVKQRVGTQYQHVEYRWNRPACGRPKMYKDNEATIAERAPYNESFAKQVQRAYDRAVIRFHKHYAGINRDDEVIRSYAPYKQAPNAILHEMSQRWVQYGKDKKFLESIVSRLKIKYNFMMMVAQQGKYKLISDALYDVHKAYHELQSLCRPDHHVVVYKGKKDPLLANRK
jgi:hypothetical protein